MRMMCEKTLRDGITNGLTGVEDIENHLEENSMRWLGHLERMAETN